ncbi:hypothetical protein [uncultured Methanobacterium sp.]|uniref:hypothetical protein n=1 Tax=uncultured Methanobacterium sp. TaxID=176306 RepID=UPI002AA8068F|nr:hypothetical protein [uncultured Methanobacterium sp.]
MKPYEDKILICPKCGEHFIVKLGAIKVRCNSCGLVYDPILVESIEKVKSEGGKIGDTYEYQVKMEAFMEQHGKSYAFGGFIGIIFSVLIIGGIAWYFNISFPYCLIIGIIGTLLWLYIFYKRHT